jgi:hypothetical protein
MFEHQSSMWTFVTRPPARYRSAPRGVRRKLRWFFRSRG